MNEPFTAEVAVFSGLRGPSRTFTYGVPDGMALAPGHLVRVALGPRAAGGVVVATGMPVPAAGLRDVDALIDPTPVLHPHQLELARWIAARYRCPLADAVRAMVPPGLARRARTPVRTRQRPRRIPAELALTEDDAVREADATTAQRDALAEIERDLERGGPFLLHGVTGSGKTEVYLRAAAMTLTRGRGRRRRRLAVGAVRAARAPRAHRRGRGAGALLQAGERSPLPRGRRGARARTHRRGHRRPRQRDAADH